MPMAEMSAPGQTWFSAASSFVGMWTVMMVAMMLPSLVPMLRRYHQALANSGEIRLARLTALVCTAYFFVWTAFGIAAFALGTAWTALAMRLPLLPRAVPIAAGLVFLMAGALQLTSWKAHHLACCRDAPQRRILPDNATTAWRHGLNLGLHCAQCSLGLMAILLIMGIMDVRAMAVVAGAITVERVAPYGERIARVTGALVIGAGLLLIVRATVMSA
jgi:predicted metal-binding membrane protein